MVEPTKEELEEIVKDSVSLCEIGRKLGMPQNGAAQTRIKKWLTKHGISIKHFSHQAAMNKFQRKYKQIEKVCPVCSNVFMVGDGEPKEKITCSYSCSNRHFADKRNKTLISIEKKRETKNYRGICFLNWKKECILCKFDKIVEVHHLDHNHLNNDKDNLVPVCSNHHRMLHSGKYGKITREEILEAVKCR